MPDLIIYFFRKFVNFNRTMNFNILNSTLLSSILPDTFVVTSSQTNRLPRQVRQDSNKSNNEDTEYKRYIKVILDLKPDNYEDMYDYYDDGKYNNNREKKINSLINELNLYREIEQNSKPITMNLNESQERKRCTKKISQNLGSINHQQSQKLRLTNIEDGIEPTLRCTDCELLKSNINSREPKNNYNSNLQLEKMDDDYFIKVLNQLIDKINKPKNVKSNLFENLPIQTSTEKIILDNSSFINQNTNGSSEEEMIVKFEKIKGNRIVNKLKSSPENIFINGNWVRNKIIENKVSDSKPLINDRRNELNDKNESISNNDMKQLNLKDSKNQVIESNENISNKFKDLSVGPEENKYISTSPLTEENKHILFSRATIMPFVVSSTSKYKSDSSIPDDSYKLKITTNEYTDQFNKEENVSSHEENNQSQYEPTINNSSTTVSIFESNEELTSDLNEASKIKNPGTVESNDNIPKTNFSNEETIVENSNLDEKENKSLDDNMNCSCNKKIIKNILSSTMVTNITEIKTDRITSPNNLKMNSHKRSNQLLKKNSEKNKAKNIKNEENLIKNKNDMSSDFLGKKQVPYESRSNNNFKETNVNMLQGSILNIDGDKSQSTNDNKKNRNMEIDLKNSSFKSIIPELKLKGQRKRNNDENTHKVEEINNKRMPLTSKTLPQKNTMQFISKIKRLPQNDGTLVRNNNKENNSIDKITHNNNIFKKSSGQMLNKIISQTPLQTISSKQIENITKSPKKLIEKIKHNIPINSKIHTVSNFGDYNKTYYTTSARKIFTHPKIFSQAPLKITNKYSPQSTPRNLEKLITNDDLNATKNSPRKFVTESDKNTSYNPNNRIFKNLKENNNKNIMSQKNSMNANNLDPIQLKRPPSLVKTIESTKIQMTPKNKIIDIYPIKIPTYVKSNDTSSIINKHILKSKISKPNLSIQSPKTFSSSVTTEQMKNNENIPLLKLNKILNNAKTKPSSEPLFLEKIDRTRYNLSNKPLTLTLKNKNILNDQSPAEQVFIKKTDTKQNLKLKYEDDDSNAALKSYSPKQSQLGDQYDHEHAPYTNEDLEPILFDELMKKANTSNKNSQFLTHSPNSGQFLNGNQRYQELDVKLLQSVPINQLKYDKNYDTQRKNKFEVNDKKHKNPPDLNESNNFSINTVSLDNDESSPNNEYLNPNRFGVLSQVKIADGVFKIPLVSQTSVDNNGSEYVSEIFIPIEKPDGKHSAISLTKLLTGDFKLLNELGVERLSVIKSKSEMDSTLSSTRTSTDCESKDLVNPNPLKILQAKQEDEKSVPIHIIQIINNGQCSYKHNGTDTIKKCEHDDDEHKFHKFQNEGRRLSSVKSQNTPNNNKQIQRKIEKAYNHFDSEILDRFLQVYSPHKT
ncbi:metacaspase-2-like [Aphis gossypii]|uniref:metacaspase-2-like n=1 Tax=Aphis gossypii TaxID=80765 RepID=UPI002158C55B|nr:metacaspase-2-like [Aphis gossypii]